MAGVQTLTGGQVIPAVATFGFEVEAGLDVRGDEPGEREPNADGREDTTKRVAVETRSTAVRLCIHERLGPFGGSVPAGRYIVLHAPNPHPTVRETA
jgi:hypothetical protein